MLFGLARVRSVARKVLVARDKRSVDIDTLRAVLRNRYHVLTLYGRKVIGPIVRAERFGSHGSERRRLRQLRRLMTREDIDLDAHARVTLNGALAQHQALETAYRFKTRLKALWSHTANDGAKRLQRLELWCAEAERSGIKALQDFVEVLQGYTLRSQ